MDDGLRGPCVWDDVDVAANPAAVVWQEGNNQNLALHDTLGEWVNLVEVVDSWTPNPKASPILLHKKDGEVKEVGSTALLYECVRQGTGHGSPLAPHTVYVCTMMKPPLPKTRQLCFEGRLSSPTNVRRY